MIKITRRNSSKDELRRVSFEAMLDVMRFSQPDWSGGDLSGVAIAPIAYVLGSEDGAATTTWQQALNDLIYALGIDRDQEDERAVQVRVTFERVITWRRSRTKLSARSKTKKQAVTKRKSPVAGR